MTPSVPPGPSTAVHLFLPAGGAMVWQRMARTVEIVFLEAHPLEADARGVTASPMLVIPVEIDPARLEPAVEWKVVCSANS